MVDMVKARKVSRDLGDVKYLYGWDEDEDEAMFFGEATYRKTWSNANRDRWCSRTSKGRKHKMEAHHREKAAI